MIFFSSISIISLIAVVTWFSIGAAAQQQQAEGLDDLDYYMNDALDYFNVRGASIAFFDKNKHDKPIIRGYGKVSASSNAQDVTGDTVFMQASVSKVFAGAAVSILVDRGILGSLDDDICDVLPDDWDRSACRNPNFPNVPVTWRMLVTHRSSLIADIPSIRRNGQWVEAAYGPEGGYADGSAAGNPTCPLDDVVGFYRDFLTNKKTETLVGAGLNVNWYDVGEANGGAWYNTKPGRRREYSNFAVGYIAALVELATGQSFPDFCREHIFVPLGMTRTEWMRDDLPPGTSQAVPTEWIRGNRYQDVGHYCFIDYASGQLRTSANDMAKFLNAMLDEYGAPTLWSDKDVGMQAMACQERNARGGSVKNCEFGVNWVVMNNAQKSNSDFWLDPFLKLDWTNGAMHDGYESGSQTQIVVLPKAGVYLSVMTNTDLNDDWAAQELAYEVMYSLGYGPNWLY